MKVFIVNEIVADIYQEYVDYAKNKRLEVFTDKEKARELYEKIRKEIDNSWGSTSEEHYVYLTEREVDI